MPSGKAGIVAAALADLATHHGVDTQHAVMVGDRAQDVAGAAANGIDCIGVGWGFAPDGELDAAGAVEIVHSSAALHETIARRDRAATPRTRTAVNPDPTTAGHETRCTPMAMFDAIRWTTRGLVTSTCRPTVIGLENVPKEGPFIVAPNHLSFLDSVIVQALMPRPVAFFAKAEYFTTGGVKGKVMKSFFEAVGSIPVERGEQAASVQALKTLLEILDSGKGVGIYPEGTRSRDGILYRGRTGVGWLALTTGAPVIPVGLIGTENLQPADSKSVKPQHFTMKVGEPLYFDKTGPDHSLPARRQATDRIMDAIAELSGQERSTSYNQSKAID